MGRPKFIRITSPQQWAVPLAPIRSELLQALRCLGPCSAAELGRMLDRPADTLYRHLAQLQRAGYVVESGIRKRGRSAERLFDLTADDFAMAFADVRSDAAKSSVARTARVFLDAMRRTIVDSAQADALVLPTPEPNFLINYELSWLTPQDFRKVRALMYQIKLLMDGARPKCQGRLYSSITVLAPVTRKKRPSTQRSSASAPPTKRRRARPKPAQ